MAAACRECYHLADEPKPHSPLCSKRERLGCSNCGAEFLILGRKDGFSHCDLHAQYWPLPD